MPGIAGIDGCRAGWVVVHEDQAGKRRCSVAGDIRSAVAGLGGCSIIGIDIPIGLPEAGPRACDVEARALLAPHRGASVFPAPIRPILDAASHAEACERRAQIDGRRISIQSFNILMKIREVESFLQAEPVAVARFHEVHPELAFAVLNGNTALARPKRKPAGLAARYALLSSCVDPAEIDAQLERWPRGDVGADDILDAYAVLLAARRIRDGSGRRVPGIPVADACGIDMAIWF